MFYKATTEIYGVHMIRNVQHTTFLQEDFANLQKKKICWNKSTSKVYCDIKNGVYKGFYKEVLNW